MCLYVLNFHLFNSSNGRKKLFLQRDSAWCTVFKIVFYLLQLFIIELVRSIKAHSHQTINMFSLSVVRNGDTSIFITENARSTPVINGGNKRDKL